MNNTQKKFGYELSEDGFLTEDSAKAYFSRFGWFAFAFFLIYIVASYYITMVVYSLAPGVATSYYFNAAMSFIPLYLAALPLSFLVLRRLPHVKLIKAKMGFGKWMLGLCMCVTLMMAGNYVAQILITAYELLTGATTQNPVESAVNSMPMWLNVIVVGILAPILEELVFRKLVCSRLLVLGEGYAIVLSSAFFALIHGNLYQLFYAFLLGCFFGFIYVKTGKIGYSIGYHIAINLLGGVIAPFILRYLDVEALMEGTLEALVANIAPLLALLAYEGVMMAAAIVGLVFLIVKRKQFTLTSGILPPPKQKRVSTVLLTSGIAAAIAIFSLYIVWSLIPAEVIMRFLNNLTGAY